MVKKEELGYDLRSYLDQIVQNPLDKFKAFTTWNQNDKEEFKQLLDKLKEPYDKKKETRQKRKQRTTGKQEKK